MIDDPIDLLRNPDVPLPGEDAASEAVLRWLLRQPPTIWTPSPAVLFCDGYLYGEATADTPGRST